MPEGCRDCRDCPLKEEVKELKEKYSSSRQRIYERLEDIERQNVRTEERYISIQNELKDMKDELSKITAKLTALSEKPAKRWDSAVSSLISSAIGVVIGYIGAKFTGGV